MGSYNNLNSIGLRGSVHLNEPTATLQWGLQMLSWANGSQSNVTYANLMAPDGRYIPHDPPDLNRLYPGRGPETDREYFEFLREYLRGG
jgi:hypothetical protein